ncbi:MAG: RHS repeat-associated core domain-containing protein, partial [Dysgonamonadaceae bacterium]|nr:RHS repeat-associated core domain-containing protein [Dysgonamonadaceae bacterium]
MKQNLLINAQIFILLSITGQLRLSAQDTLVLNTANTAGGSINACAAIVLKPGFSFKAVAGKSMTLKTGDAYCSPYVDQSLNLPANQNYIITVTPLDATDKVDISPTALTLARGANARVTVQYFDGLGRPVETVQKGITPSKADLVAYLEYDAFGRESKSWLPVRAANNNGTFVGLSDFQAKASATYNNTTYNVVADANPYSYPVYEPSPLNRIEQQYGPGANWHNNGKAVKINYLTNLSGYPCAYYYISGDNLVRNNNYGNSQLYVTETTDEEGNISYEFKDKLDRVVLQRQMDGSTKHDTYFVYDDFGLLRYMLSPLAADGTGNGSYNENSTVIKNYAYVYKYDARKRCIWKQLPGCAPVYYVYDKADRLIFLQDGEQRTRNEWIFNKYDALGRIILSGTYTDSRTQSQLAEAFRNTLVVEYPTGGNYGYSWNVPPVVSPDKVLTVNHYDNYQHLLDQESSFNNSLNYETKPGYGARYINASCAACSAKGLLVGTRVKIGGGSGEIVTTLYYDERGGLVQKKSINHLGGLDKEFYAYSFTGQVEKKEHIHTGPGTDMTENYRYEYDHAGRLTDTYYRLSGHPEYLLSHNTYDELGRLKTTTPYDLAGFKSTYAYDIRSLIRTIGSSNYTEALTYKYNGNVERMIWQHGSAFPNLYTFGYDGLSRLKTANYSNQQSPTIWYSTSYVYDKNGNITSLSRYGQQTSAGGYNLIDNLTLNYGGSNQLKYVNDTGESVFLSTSYDFKNYSSGTSEYVYNANGSMTKDLNKGISEIAYNILNLPLKIDIKNPVAEARNEYLYSAGGQKLKVVHKWASSYSSTPVIGSAVNTSALNNTKTTDYAGNFIYENNSLKRILTENGYYEGGIFYFYLKNHLGSNVMTVNRSGNIVQNNHYYPFGLPMGMSDNQGAQPYKYTGKELDMQHGLMLYDQLARQYDPVTGRFLTPDPLAEKYPGVSSYAYCGNNPVNRIDPDGLDYWSTNDPAQIRLFFNAMGSSVRQFDFSGWQHATDAEFTRNLTYNDETNKFYTSYGTIENGEVVIVGRSFDADFTPVSFDGLGYDGAFVYRPRTGIGRVMESIDRFLNGSGKYLTYNDGITNWSVNASGRITGVTPFNGLTIGYPPAVGMKGGKFTQKMGKAKGNMTGNRNVQQKQFDAVATELRLT